MSGALAYHAGLAAEDSVIAQYLRRGMELVAQRWRGRAGEIDIILRDGADLVFVEVKKSRSFDRALERLGDRQIARIFDTAAEFMASQPLGLNTPTRFDVALVDSSGQVRIVENALGP